LTSDDALFVPQPTVSHLRREGQVHLGPVTPNVSMTQGRYVARGRSDIEVADLLERAINDE
jgi:hypothetical protein